MDSITTLTRVKPQFRPNVNFSKPKFSLPLNNIIRDNLEIPDDAISGYDLANFILENIPNESALEKIIGNRYTGLGLFSVIKTSPISRQNEDIYIMSIEFMKTDEIYELMKIGNFYEEAGCHRFVGKLIDEFKNRRSDIQMDEEFMAYYPFEIRKKMWKHLMDI